MPTEFEIIKNDSFLFKEKNYRCNIIQTSTYLSTEQLKRIIPITHYFATKDQLLAYQKAADTKPCTTIVSPTGTTKKHTELYVALDIKKGKAKDETKPYNQKWDKGTFFMLVRGEVIIMDTSHVTQFLMKLNGSEAGTIDANIDESEKRIRIAPGAKYIAGKGIECSYQEILEKKTLGESKQGILPIHSFYRVSY